MDDRLQTILDVARRLEELGIGYVIGGSVASSRYGEPRTTNDVDILIDLRPAQVRGLLNAFVPDFYLDEITIQRALESGRSFNAISQISLLKVDFFIAGIDPFTRQQFERRLATTLSSESDQNVFLASPEDTILAKLRWYLRGGSSSNQQLRDVASVIKIVGPRLDLDYMLEWAAKLGVSELLAEVLNRSA
jgi:hypothetical protein